MPQVMLSSLWPTLNKSDDVAFHAITDDTRTLNAGDVLVWDTRIAPKLTDKIIADAKAKKAAAIVSNVKADGVLFCEEPGDVLAAYARQQWPNQPKQLVAITGTNGKTSVAWFYAQLMQACGFKSASIGTLGVHVNGELITETGYTSPTALMLHPILHDLHKRGVTHCCIEAGSHGLALHRLDGAEITAAGFTNLTQDHLDFHGTMDNYALAKGRLFGDVMNADGVGVLPIQNTASWPYAAMVKQRGGKVLTFGSGNAELIVDIIEASAKGLLLKIKYEQHAAEIMVPLLGEFQAQNIGAAVGLALASGGDMAKILKALETIKAPPGRMELIPAEAGFSVVVDYAHTPDALQNALQSLIPLTAEKLHVVFGCGGDRDNTKRAPMGAIAAELADDVIITDDNPRTEDAAQIRQQVGMGAPNAKQIADRKAAIAYALEHAKAGDIVLVAGKGHEQGQIVGKTKMPFDDKTVVCDVLKTIKNSKKVA